MIDRSDSLYDMDEEKIIDYLLKSIDDKRKDFSLFAIKQLKHYNSPKIVEELQRMVGGDDIDKKVAAISSLKRRKPNNYTKEIVFKQLISKDENVRSEASNLLLEFDENILLDLEKINIKQVPEYTQQKIIWLLGEVGNSDTINILESYRKILSKKKLNSLNDAIESIKKKHIKLMFKKIKDNDIE